MQWALKVRWTKNLLLNYLAYFLQYFMDQHSAVGIIWYPCMLQTVQSQAYDAVYMNFVLDPEIIYITENILHYIYCLKRGYVSRCYIIIFMSGNQLNNENVLDGFWVHEQKLVKQCQFIFIRLNHSAGSSQVSCILLYRVGQLRNWGLWNGFIIIARS